MAKHKCSGAFCSCRADSWGTPEHEAAMDAQIGKVVDCPKCKDRHTAGPCAGMWTDEQLANYQRMIREGGWSR